MILDHNLEISDAQSITGATGAIAGTNVIDLSVAGRDVRGDLHLICVVDTTCDSTGEAATLTVTVVDDDNESLSSPATLFTTSAIAEASLVAGYQVFDFNLNSIAKGAGQRYLGVKYTVGTEAFTAGKVNTYLVVDKQTA